MTGLGIIFLLLALLAIFTALYLSVWCICSKRIRTKNRKDFESSQYHIDHHQHHQEHQPSTGRLYPDMVDSVEELKAAGKYQKDSKSSSVEDLQQQQQKEEEEKQSPLLVDIPTEKDNSELSDSVLA